MKWIIGIDEVGRGPLAGPVTLCGVAIRASEYKKAQWRGLTDSKQMKKGAREDWYKRAREMEKKGMISITLASQSAAQIDRKGISTCIRSCITKILKDLALDPKTTQVLLDGGLRAPVEYIHQQTIIRGDQKKKIISLASVVAKVSRDAHMTKLAKKYPQFGWEINKGYGTIAHRQMLKKRGFTSFHRKSFLSQILDNYYKVC